MAQGYDFKGMTNREIWEEMDGAYDVGFDDGIEAAMASSIVYRSRLGIGPMPTIRDRIKLSWYVLIGSADLFVWGTIRMPTKKWNPDSVVVTTRKTSHEI